MKVWKSEESEKRTKLFKHIMKKCRTGGEKLAEVLKIVKELS